RPHPVALGEPRGAPAELDGPHLLHAYLAEVVLTEPDDRAEAARPRAHARKWHRRNALDRRRELEERDVRVGRSDHVRPMGHEAVHGIGHQLAVHDEYGDHADGGQVEAVAAVSTTAGAMSVPEQSPTTDSEKRSPTAATAGKSDVGWPLMMRGSKPVSSPPHGVAARADANRRLTDSAA